jgi:BASS family bile acid:Na+ symporter
MKISRFLSNSSLMMLTAITVVLLVGGFPHGFPISNGDISMISLILMMTLSLSSIEIKGMKIGRYKTDIRNAFILSFGLLTVVTLAMAFLFSGDLRSGWILEAAVPSAVSVISFTCLWGGETESSAVSSVAIYLLSLFITPIVTLLFLGKAVSEVTLLYYVGLQIVVPLLLSRVAKRFLTSANVRNILINICFFILVIAVTGENRVMLFSAGTIVGLIVALAAARTFGVGIIMNRFLLKNGVNQKSAVSATLFSTYKNTGMAASLALVLLGPTAALPAAACMITEVFWLIFAGKFLFDKERAMGLAVPK